MSEYIHHENVDSSRSESIYGTQHSQTKSRSTPPYPKHQTILLQPDQTEPAYMHATHTYTSLKSREEKGGRIDSDRTITVHSSRRSSWYELEYLLPNTALSTREKQKITNHIIRRPYTPELRSRPMMVFSFSRSRDRRGQRLQRRWTSSPKPTTRAPPPAPSILLTS